MKLSRLFFFSLLFISAPLFAQEADDLRGGWMADIDGTRHIYYIVFRHDKISGVYCNDCTKLDNLALIDDGRLDDSGLNFTLYHYPSTSEPYQELVQAQLSGDELIVTRQRKGSNNPAEEIAFHRTQMDTFVPTPIAEYSSNRPAGGRTRILAGPAEQITAENVLGTWLWGTGPGKQYFFFLQHGDEIRGMVCGPCDSVRDMAPLESITMQGTNFHFEIVHEDNGFGVEEYGPFSNVTDAKISRNELQMNVTSSYLPSDSVPVEMTLLGPVH